MLGERALQRAESSPSGPASPSTVVSERPSACTASIRHARTGSPSSCTVQAPHTPCSQPTWVPVRPGLVAHEVRQQRARLDLARRTARPLIVDRDPHHRPSRARAPARRTARVSPISARRCPPSPAGRSPPRPPARHLARRARRHAGPPRPAGARSGDRPAPSSAIARVGARGTTTAAPGEREVPVRAGVLDRTRSARPAAARGTSIAHSSSSVGQRGGQRPPEQLRRRTARSPRGERSSKPRPQRESARPAARRWDRRGRPSHRPSRACGSPACPTCATASTAAASRPRLSGALERPPGGSGRRCAAPRLACTGTAPSSASSRLRSTSSSGRARRKLSIGTRLWPPASGLASSVPASSSSASASEAGAAYAKRGGLHRRRRPIRRTAPRRQPR